MKKLLFLFVVTVGIFHSSVTFAATFYLKTAGGLWSASSTWSSVSAGGVDNAGPPVASTDVVFELLSGPVTIDSGAVARSLDINSGTGAYNNTVTHNSSVTLTLGDGTAGAGNTALDLSGGGASFAWNLGGATNSTITFISTSATQQSIKLGGKSMGGLIFNAASNGSWTHGDGITVGTGTITITKGTWTTNSQTVTAGGIGWNNSNTKSITFGTSTMTLSGSSPITAVTAGTTFSAGSETITCTASTPFFTGGGSSFGSVTINGTLGGAQITGTNTFANLTVNAGATKVGVINFGNDQTITGTLTLASNAGSKINRLYVTSDTPGTPRTLTAAVVSANGVDFRDITGVGAATWDMSAASNYTGDAGGNTMQALGTAAFTTAATQTSTGTASFTWSTHGWTSRVPLPQDDVNITNSFVAGRTVTMDMPRSGKNLTIANTGNSFALSKGVATTIFGSLVMPGTALMTQSGTTNFIFENRSPATLTSAGQTFTNQLQINSIGSKLTLADAYISDRASSAALSHTAGEFDTANFSVNLTAGGYTASGAVAKTTTLGSTLMTLGSSGSAFTIGTATVTATTGTVKFTNTSTSSVTFSGGNKSFGNIYFSRATSTADNIVTGGNTFITFKDDGTGAHSIKFATGATQTLSGSCPTAWAVSGTAGNLISIDTNAGTGTHTLSAPSCSNASPVSADYLNIQHSVAIQANTWYAGINSINNQATSTAGSGWIFTAPVVIGGVVRRTIHGIIR